MKAADTYDLIVVGGGAAGFFGAINTASLNPSLKILILEKSNRLLTKVRISGGGRCNVTHHCFEPAPLSKHYPRGQKELKKLFRQFKASDLVEWFESRGVSIKTEDDGRMFPVTDRSETIIDCFLSEADRLKIRIAKNSEVIKLEKLNSTFLLTTADEKHFNAKKILVTTGGSPKVSSYDWITRIGHSIEKPIPSLFTFNDSSKQFKDLMGISVNHGQVQITGTKFKEAGPILITHWGLSGPAVIKLSAWAADYLFHQNYSFTVLVNWLGQTSEEELRVALINYQDEHPNQKIANQTMVDLPSRLWSRLCERAEIDQQKKWSELTKKQINRLIENLIRCPFQINGKTTFKEEFVTCGGIKLEEVDIETMQSKKVAGIYFAGEVLNIDGETGGFNFQSAWTTAVVAAREIADRE